MTPLPIRTAFDRDIKLVALDLDGTLLSPDGSISERNQGAIAQAVAQGVHVAIVSARSFGRSRPFAQQLGLNAPVICCGGALIADPVTGEAIVHTPVPLTPGRRLAEHILWRRMFGMAHRNGRYVAQASTVRDHPALVPLVLPQLDAIDDLAGGIEFGATFLRVLGDAAVTELVNIFEPLHDLNLVTLRWQGVPDLAIYDPRVSKGFGLCQLCELLGVPVEQTVAMGDNEQSDGSMVNVAGISVAMASGDLALQQRASYVTSGNDQDGVALALERLVLR